MLSGVRADAFDPFRKIACDPTKFGFDSVENAASMATVAIGLALRKAGDR